MGAIPIGKTNTPELGHKGITDNLAFGPTSSPLDATQNAGGIGLQIVGYRWRDTEVLAAARAVERYHPWYEQYPHNDLVHD